MRALGSMCVCGKGKKKIKKSGRRQDWVKDKAARKKSEKRREKNISAKKGKNFFWGEEREGRKRGKKLDKNLPKIKLRLYTLCAKSARTHRARIRRRAYGTRRHFKGACSSGEFISLPAVLPTIFFAKIHTKTKAAPKKAYPIASW